MQRLLFFLLLTLSLYAQSLDTLLEAYRYNADLSQKTKLESAGHLIVYTRDDLERMQVMSLKDILKSLRFFSYNENRMGLTDILNQDPLTYYSSSIRIYLNDHEMASSLSGSGLMIYGDMEMDFIDHVEIYQGFPHFEFGIEPATVVIRLYSKDASREIGGRLKAYGGSRGLNGQNGYLADEMDDFSYFAYIGRYDNQREHYGQSGQDIARDMESLRFYGALATDNHRIELHAAKQDGDGFLTSLIGAPPKKSRKELEYIDAALHSEFMDDSLKFNLSYTSGEMFQSGTFDGFIITPGGLHSLYEQTLYEKTLTVDLKKSVQIENHDISAGLQYRYKHFDLGSVAFDGTKMELPQAYDAQNIYSFFIQDLFALSDNQMLTLSYMYQFYDIDANQSVNEPKLNQLRLGYIHTGEAWSSKSFLSFQQFAPEPYMLISPQYGNIELTEQDYMLFSQEFGYSFESVDTGILFAFGESKNLPYLDLDTLLLVNNKQRQDFFFASFDLKYQFRSHDTLDVNLFMSRSELALKDQDHSTLKGGTLRLLNSFGAIDLFNELVYRESKIIKSGVDVSSGVRYHVTDDFTLAFKGENIFDSGATTEHIQSVSFIPMQLGYLETPLIERRFYLSAELLF